MVGGASKQGLHVAFTVGKTRESRMAIQEVFEPIGVKLLGSQEVQQYSWIEVARTSTHRYPARWGQPHGCVNRFPVEHRRQAAPVAQVRENGAARQVGTEPMNE